MKNLLGFAVIISLLTGCASYSPIQHVGGHRHKDKVVKDTCTHYILTFPAWRKSMTIANAVEELNVKDSDIYSIEVSGWYYLWPIYTQSCIYFNMNDKYVGPVSSSKPSDFTPAPAPVPGKQYEPGDEAGFTGSRQADFKRCDELMGLAKSNCRKTVYKYYEDLDKSKKK